MGAKITAILSSLYLNKTDAAFQNQLCGYIWFNLCSLILSMFFSGISAVEGTTPPKSPKLVTGGGDKDEMLQWEDGALRRWSD